MARACRPTPAAVSANPGIPWELGALVDYLERRAPDRARVGEGPCASSEAVVIRGATSLRAATGDVDSAKRRDDGVWELVARGLSLAGAEGPLAGFLAEELDRVEPEGALRAEVLDIFHRRLFGLWHRASRRGALAGEHRIDGEDPWSRRVVALLGGRDALPPGMSAVTALRLAPLLLSGMRGLEVLERLLVGALEPLVGPVAVAVTPFAGTWATLDPRAQLRLGVVARLGEDTVVGRRVRDRGAAITVELSPDGGCHPRRCQPAGDVHTRVTSIVHRVLGASVLVEIMLPRSLQPGARLGSARTSEDLRLSARGGPSVERAGQPAVSVEWTGAEPVSASRVPRSKRRRSDGERTPSAIDSPDEEPGHRELDPGTAAIADSSHLESSLHTRRPAGSERSRPDRNEHARVHTQQPTAGFRRREARTCIDS
ncbi:MAG: type VI secretion system baseplate subunit TssG [Nannocystaceae bacterium]